MVAAALPCMVGFSTVVAWHLLNQQGLVPGVLGVQCLTPTIKNSTLIPQDGTKHPMLKSMSLKENMPIDEKGGEALVYIRLPQ